MNQRTDAKAKKDDQAYQHAVTALSDAVSRLRNCPFGSVTVTMLKESGYFHSVQTEVKKRERILCEEKNSIVDN